MLDGYIGSLPAFITTDDKKDIAYLCYTKGMKKRIIINPDKLINDGCVILSNGRFITCKNNSFTLLTPYIEDNTVIYYNKVLDISHGAFRKFDGTNDIRTHVIITFRTKIIIYDVSNNKSTIISSTNDTKVSNIHIVRFVSNYIYQVITGHDMYLFDMKLNKKVFEDKFQDLQRHEYDSLIEDYKAMKPICGAQYVLFPLPEIEIHNLHNDECVFLDDSYALEGEIIFFYKTYDDRYIRTKNIDEAEYICNNNGNEIREMVTNDIVNNRLWNMKTGKIVDKNFKYSKPLIKTRYIYAMGDTLRVDFNITEKDTEQYIMDLRQFLHSILRDRVVSPIINIIGKFIIKEHVNDKLVVGRDSIVNELTNSILSMPERGRYAIYKSVLER